MKQQKLQYLLERLKNEDGEEPHPLYKRLQQLAATEDEKPQSPTPG
jgi:hypothetical protein